jgi:ATP-dependent Clp protease protease subunit
MLNQIRQTDAWSTQITTTRRRGAMSISASNNKSFEAYARQTLASDWDIRSASAPPARLPRMEELDTTNMLLRQRILFLGSKVDDLSADFIISQLLILDAEDPTKDIKLFINSPGGSITAGMGVYDAMKSCKADVSTICFGLAASMGAFLLAAGTKGKRFCMPNAKVMIHQVSGPVGGTTTESILRLKEACYLKGKLNKIFSRITGKPETQIEIDTDRDNFLNAWEAKEYGLVDEVIDDGKPGLVAPIVDSTPPHIASADKTFTLYGRGFAPVEVLSEEILLQNGKSGQ